MNELSFCELCGDYSFAPFLSTEGYGVKYNLMQCRTCRLVLMNPRPSPQEIKKYYESDYFKQQIGSETPTESYVNHIMLLDVDRHAFVKSVAKNLNGSMLDVGCGCGTFMDRMRSTEDKLKIYGVEPNVGFAETAIK